MLRNSAFLLLLFTMLYSCRPEPATVFSYFKIYNQSEHTVLLEIYKRDGTLVQSINVEDQSFYENYYNHTISCCNSCFLSGRDSVIIYYDDTVKMLHYLYDTTTPSNNIYNSLYFVEDYKDCLFEFTVTNEDYLEALGNP